MYVSPYSVVEQEDSFNVVDSQGLVVFGPYVLKDEADGACEFLNLSPTFPETYAFYVKYFEELGDEEFDLGQICRDANIPYTDHTPPPEPLCWDLYDTPTDTGL